MNNHEVGGEMRFLKKPFNWIDGFNKTKYIILIIYSEKFICNGENVDVNINKFQTTWNWNECCIKFGYISKIKNCNNNYLKQLLIQYYQINLF